MADRRGRFGAEAHLILSCCAVRWLLLDKFESWRYAPQFTAPTTILAAERNEMVPRASMELLRSRFKCGIVLHLILAAGGAYLVFWTPTGSRGAPPKPSQPRTPSTRR